MVKREKLVLLNVNIPARDMARLDEAARRDRTNRSIVVRQAIRRHLQIKEISIEKASEPSR